MIFEPDEELPQNKRSLPSNEDDFVGPNPHKLLKMEYHDLILNGLPSSDSYQISYMHRDVVTNVLASTKTDFIITVSLDGHIKFWKKIFHLIEFVKNFKAHAGLITGATLSKDHDLFCSVGLDRTLKIFDVFNCDLRTVLKLTFIPSCCEFIPQENCEWFLLAVGEEKTGKIYIIDSENRKSSQFENQQHEYILEQDKKQEVYQEHKKQEGIQNVLQILSIHRHPIKFIKMNWALNVVISIDERCSLELWDPNTFDFPTSFAYKCKIETDFLKLLQANSIPLSLNISGKGTYVAVCLKDKSIRVFNVKTGKIVVTVCEGMKEAMKIQEDTSHPEHENFFAEEHEFEKKINLEKDLQIAKQYLYTQNVEFDESQQFLIYPSFHGIKFYSLSRHTVERVIAHKESERFVRLAIFQGKVMRNPTGNSNAQGERKGIDPIIVCTAFKKSRFYIFSKRSPEVNSENILTRDMINERPNKEELQALNPLKMTEKQNEVVLQTTMGDIHLLLYLDDCPKTCENFIKLVKKGYYTGHIFHRVIKGFMNQTGCPKGDGTGGESIWGGNFEDELRPEKHRFQKPYLLAMANRGPNTNGSQFFITVIPCPWLDNKHTIFGRVIKGIETVCDINKLKTDKVEKPIATVKIMNAKVM